MGRFKNEYQSRDVLYRPPDGSVYELPKNLIGSYLDPSLWAYSTLPPGDYEDLIDIYVIKQEKYQRRSTIRERMWLHDILDDNNIPYQVVIKTRWADKRNYAEDQFICVEEKHKKKAKRLINTFLNPDNTVQETSDDENSSDSYIDGMLQKKCTNCGEEIDFDYQKCPFCKFVF